MTWEIVEAEEKTREGTSSTMRKEVAGNRNLLFKFKYEQRRDTGYTLLLYLCYKDDNGKYTNETISYLLEKKKANC